MGSNILKRLCAVFYLLVLATPAAAVERGDAERVFGAFLACKDDIFSLLTSDKADFRALTITPYDHEADGVNGHYIAFAAPVVASGLPLGRYVQFEAVGIAVPHFAWGFEVERNVPEVANAIEALLPGARFVAKDGHLLELKLSTEPEAQRSDTSVAPEDSYRKIVIRQANDPTRTLLMCDASKDRMSGLAIDEETGRKRLPSPEDLFPSVKVPAKADKILDAFVACKPSFFNVLWDERKTFPRVRVEAFESPGNKPHVPEAVNTYNESVTFERPVKIGDFSVVRFFQRRTIEEGKPTRFAWAFQVNAPPREVARAIAERYRVRFWGNFSLLSSRDAAVGPVSKHLDFSSYFDPDEQATVTCEPDEGETKDFRLPWAEETFGLAELGPPPLIRGNRLVNALLQCRQDFFAALGEEKDSFGKMTFKDAMGTYREPGGVARAALRVAFEKPVYVSGFMLTGYIQQRVDVAGQPKLIWGFQTPGNEDDLIRVAENRTGSSYVENEGWSLDLEAEATGYTPSEALGFADGFIGCTTPLASGKTPPEPVDLFRNEHGK
ncbi:hypothetical protein AC244_30510 [Ensifer adhaerens]|uniref:Uncharacterized protein n=1 Tax=Ensifer adhaerens TaxID=106592 RepID=A0A0L8BG48_ENSAD|nr:hypothetical protein [Ensifer adhaerens]KOF13574.1 hypothetical protein AC244_30510 [Ensifer adhaerens]